VGVKRCMISMAVWGDWHVQCFLDLNLPTLLAARNLPAFTKLLRTDYLIYTTARDWQRIRRAPLFRELAKLVNITFVELHEADIKTPMQTHNLVWDKGRVAALATGAMAMVMPPDVAWSDGSLAHIAELVERGRSAIFLNWHLRAVAETFIPQFLDLHSGGDLPISVSGRELVSLAIENIHPLCCAYLRDSTAFPHHPEMIFWPIAGQGLLMHVFALIPFIFDPSEFQLTANKSIADLGDVSRLHFVADSDDVFMASLAPLGKDRDWYQRNARIDPVRFAQWWTYYDSPSNDHLARVPFRLHFAEVDETLWRRAEHEALNLIRRLSANRELYRIYVAARRLECARAAQLIAASIHLGVGSVLARRLEPMTVFLPRDEAFGSQWEEISGMLLNPGNKKVLIEFLRAHFAPSPDLEKTNSRPSERLDSDGDAELHKLDAGFRAGAHTVYPIRRLLAKEADALTRSGATRGFPQAPQ
jgi:hypothetical protein